jgi:serine protease Do
MTDGIVSAINRNLTTDGRTLTLIQTNAALNSGNSGGPLINCYGQVIGINTMKIGDYVSSAGVEGLGFAIPSTTVKFVVDQLISQGYVSGRPELGIIGVDVPEFYQFYHRMPAGVYVNAVAVGSDAEAKGIQVKDIILAVDGMRVTDTDEIESILYNYKPGDEVTLIIYRAGRQYEVQIVLGESVS